MTNKEKELLKGGLKTALENLEDTLYDIAGYAIMWIVLRKEGYELDDFRTLIEQ